VLILAAGDILQVRCLVVRLVAVLVSNLVVGWAIAQGTQQQGSCKQNTSFESLRSTN
jgi:hypothetical protein